MLGGLNGARSFSRLTVVIVSSTWLWNGSEAYQRRGGVPEAWFPVHSPNSFQVDRRSHPTSARPSPGRSGMRGPAVNDDRPRNRTPDCGYRFTSGPEMFQNAPSA